MGRVINLLRFAQIELLEENGKKSCSDYLAVELPYSFFNLKLQFFILYFEVCFSFCYDKCLFFI